MRARSALMLALAAPALAHAAGHGHGQHEAHRRQVAHMYAYEERQLGGLLGGGAASTGSSTTEEEESTSVAPRPSTSVDDESTTSAPPRSTPNPPPGQSSSTSATGTMSGSGSMSVPSGTGLSTSSGPQMSSSSSVPSSAPSSQGSSSSSASASASMSETTALTVDAAGKTVTQVITVPISQSSSSSASQSSAASGNSDKSDDGPAISKGAIIGIAVGVGAVVFALIGMAIWRMKRRSAEEDEAIRWPELNRHGDSDAHHALPARQTGQHGIETSPLERSLTNGSDMYMPSHSASTHQHHHMALGGSNFGASSALDAYDEKAVDMPNPHSGGGGVAGYDAYEQYYAQQTQHPSSLQPHAGAGSAYDAYGNPSDNYTSFPPQVGMQVAPGQGGPGMAYDSDSEGHAPMGQVGGAVSYGHGYGQGQR